MLQRKFLTSLVLLALLTAACGAQAPEPTPTAQPSETPSTTPTPEPTLTPSVTPTPTSSPTETHTPTITPTATNTAPPTTTPVPVSGFLYDNWDFVDAPAGIIGALNSSLLAFVNTNNRDAVGDVRTPQPANDNATLYYLNPNGGAPIPILQMTAQTGDQIFVAPSGNALAYMRIENNPSTDGFYVVDLTLDTPIRGRILPFTSLVQRGIYSRPSWSPSGERLALALESGYDLDIYTVGRDGSSPTNLTNSGSYDFWPVWSPDGSSIAFVSDRARCPSWRPGEPETCDGTGAPRPTGGYVYVIDPATREVRQISQQWVTEPPRWVNPRQLSYASGDPAFGDPERSLWIADVITGQTQRVTLSSGDDAYKLSEAWAPNGRTVIYQAAGTATELVVASIDGSTLYRGNALTFTRYGLSAAWAPSGNAIAVGGIEGQCPYGVIVTEPDFDFIARGNPPPSMCQPTYSPNGNLIAFTGVNPRIDGRMDVYVANANGFGAQNLTVNLRGNIRLLGWVGGG
ncbi:MAG: PD40 domain-containing protein [Pleurocapsa minor GSE-CHR-MK-17-07R]|jgi:Tol biopolymer transport system component|nr:PD40 domain-containing protein [Pleurocapsa minor GSE-CHR-MK 17-07R]